ncbi:MAG: hypothetical protein ACTSUE_19310, partial [Promethearchaeota archaeon]
MMYNTKKIREFITLKDVTRPEWTRHISGLQLYPEKKTISVEWIKDGEVPDSHFTNTCKNTNKAKTKIKRLPLGNTSRSRKKRKKINTHNGVEYSTSFNHFMRLHHMFPKLKHAFNETLKSTPTGMYQQTEMTIPSYLEDYKKHLCLPSYTPDSIAQVLGFEGMQQYIFWMEQWFPEDCTELIMYLLRSNAYTTTNDAFNDTIQ